MPRLTVNPDRCEHRRIEYSAREWDQTPRISTIREIDRLLPDISRIAANSITHEADINVIRTVHFNIMAEKEFENKNFERLVQFIADFIEFRLDDRQIRDAAQGLEDSVKAAVTLHATSLVSEFNELDDLVQDSRNRDFIRAVDTNLGRYKDVTTAITEMHSGDQSDRRNGRDVRDSRDVRDDRYSRSGSERDYGRSSGNERSSRDDRYARDTGERSERDDRYSRSSREERYGRDSRNDRDSRYERDRGSNAPQRDYVNPNYVEDDFVQETPKKLESTGRYNLTEMQGSQDDFVQEAKNVVEDHKLSGRMMESKPMFKGIYGEIPLLTTPNGMSEMDMFKHAAIYGDGVSDAKDMSAEIVRVFTAAQALTAENVTAESIEKEVVVNTSVKLYNNIATMCEATSTDAVLNTIENSGENTDGKRQLYHTLAIVDNSIVGFNNLNDFQQNLNECKTMQEIVGYLKRARNAVNTHASPEAAYASDLRAAVELFDRVITKEINGYCRDVLRISDGDAIASAIESLETLLNELHSVQQTGLQSALIGFLSTLTINITDCLDPKNKLVDSVKESNGVEDPTIGVAFLPQSYILSHIPFTLREIGYEINKPMAVEVTGEFSFLRAALDISKTTLMADPQYADSHRIMVTRDRQAFRIHSYPNRKDVFVLCPIVIN